MADSHGSTTVNKRGSQQGNGLNSIEDALTALATSVTSVGTETIALAEATGRVLAQPITALFNSPPFNSSAMDGYALRASDANKRLPISQRIAAGEAPSPLAVGSCARIFTGAPLPEGADCVVMQEDVSPDDGYIQAPEQLTTGNNVRLCGRETKAGECLIPAGHILDAAAIGVIASQGLSVIEVRLRPRVALLATGNELVAPGTTLAAGKIYDSNRFMLTALLPRFGYQVVLSEHVADTLSETQTALERAAQIADVVITTGGVSVGEEDHVRAAVEQCGSLDLWRLDIRPGKPLALGRLRRTDGSEARFVGLAGNPVSSFVGAWLFLRPLAAAFLKAPSLERLTSIKARAAFDTTTQLRWHYMRVTLEHVANDGVAIAKAYADQDSSLLRSCLDANALAVIRPYSEIAEGDPVECLLLV